MHQVGITALWLACKYEEGERCPLVYEFAATCNGRHTESELRGMEKSILDEVGWQLTVPSTYYFLPWFLKAADCNDKKARLFTEYLAELALVDHKMLKWKCSQIAAAAVYITGRAVGLPDAYPYALRKHSSHELEDLEKCIADLELLREAAVNSDMQAVRKKYCGDKYDYVAEMSVPRISLPQKQDTNV